MVGNLERFQQNYNRIKMDTIMLHSRKYVSNSTYVQLSNFPTAVVFGNNNSNPYDHILSSKPPNLYRNSGPSVYVCNFLQWLLKLWRTGLKAFYEKLFPLTTRLLFRWGWSKITFLWLMRLFIFWKWKWRRKETTGSCPLNRILIKLMIELKGIMWFQESNSIGTALPSHIIFFADDALLFLKAELQNWKSILEVYGVASGQRVNQGKRLFSRRYLIDMILFVMHNKTIRKELWFLFVKPISWLSKRLFFFFLNQTWKFWLLKPMIIGLSRWFEWE